VKIGIRYKIMGDNMGLRVKLSETISFEPSMKSVKIYIFWAIIQFVIYTFHKNFLIFIVLLGILTAVFIWVELVYYPLNKN